MPEIDPTELLNALMPFAAFAHLAGCNEGDTTEVAHVWAGGARCAITAGELARAREAWESTLDRLGIDKTALMA